MQRKKKHGYTTPPRNALDDLASEVRKEKLNKLPAGFNSDDVVESEEDVEDLVFQHAVLPNRTGNFDIDFPDSPRQSKGRGKRSNTNVSVVNLKLISSEITTRQEDLGLNNPRAISNVKDGKTNASSLDLNMNGNIRPSGVTSRPTVVSNVDSTEESDRDINDINVILKNPSGTCPIYIMKCNKSKKNRVTK